MLFLESFQFALIIDQEMVNFINQKKLSESFRPRLRLGSSVLAGVL